MQKLGIIGLGDIAAKAYLPIYGAKEDVEFHLYTRNKERLASISRQYRFDNIHHSLESLIESGIKGAFVHSSTESHFEIVHTLLVNNIHVYVDKPITYDFDSSKKLMELAKKNGLWLMVGFNRRYAPAYQKLKELQNPNMIIMQKNRNSQPSDIRTFVFDDYIHVLDTMRYLFPVNIEDIVVSGRKVGNTLYHAIVQFIGKGCNAIGIMNRDSGTTEERLEVMCPNEKRVAINVSEVIQYQDRNELKIVGSDWEPTLHKRGFYQIVDEFIHTVNNDEAPKISASDLLQTHEICEIVVSKLEQL
ncbi:Gfo/Idh/MocA family oxidoreductase [Bacillus sp. FJAT-49736]|uniref:Gfo/Idh/MocA family protein n=1 Tax=Bacillus sp. FJAT-49736 TaxID=2833582 RepID=UPI001BCA360D|nr:Gfo/Idh/MocA family oxidoreductase [Bacillus sp. FJAT-49736]MBS4173092.1 Gfo/Idh/MocA family oxidoreductase [Bacillus sp. FJAT-49736]